MVLRARWILGGAGETEGDEEAVAEEEEEEEVEEEEEGAGAGKDLLLPGPETLIFARPGDNVEEVEGDEHNEEEDVDGMDFAACPVKGSYEQLRQIVLSNYDFRKLNRATTSALSMKAG